jgi:hypothetical protein
MRMGEGAWPLACSVTAGAQCEGPCEGTAHDQAGRVFPGRGPGPGQLRSVAGTSAGFAPRAPFAITGASATLDYLRDNTARSNQDNPGINPAR